MVGAANNDSGDRAAEVSADERIGRILRNMRAKGMLGEGTPDLALGLWRSRDSKAELLLPFARSKRALTRKERPYATVYDIGMVFGGPQKGLRCVIDHALEGGATIHFNLTEIDEAKGGVAVYELRYLRALIAGHPELTAQVRTYGTLAAASHTEEEGRPAR